MSLIQYEYNVGSQCCIDYREHISEYNPYICHGYIATAEH